LRKGARIRRAPSQRAAALLASAFLVVLSTSAASAQSAYLVRDIATGSIARGAAVEPRAVTSAGRRAFFVGDLEAMPEGEYPDPPSGLWVTDGTTAGTRPLKRLCPMNCHVQAVGSTGSLFFLLSQSDTVDDLLWRSDGTPSGTFPLNESGPVLRVFSYDPTHFAFFNGELFFVEDYAGGVPQHLWRSDGTVAGTTVVADLGPSWSPVSGGLTVFRGALYFLGPQSDGTVVLWRSNGTPAGTIPIPVPTNAYPHLLAAAGGHLFFVARDAQQNNTSQLWATDGSAPPAPITHFVDSPAGLNVLKVVGSRVYFIAADAVHGQQAWVSDGTAAGTVPITAFANPAPFGAPGAGYLEAAGGRLVFFASDGTGTTKLWASSGPPDSVVSLAAVSPTYSSSPMEVGGRVVFFSGDVTDDLLLWSTDGTVAGTGLLKGVCNYGYCPQPLERQVGGEIFFYAATQADLVLWQTDGTAAGTKAFQPGVTAFDPYQTPEIAALGTKLVYAAPDAEGSELWTSDGTKAGTRQLTDASGPNSSDPGEFVALGENVFFSASAAPGLWQSAGTPATTVPVPGATTFSPAFVASGSSMFFVGGDGQLWRADGSANGTRPLTTFAPAQLLGSDTQLVPFGAGIVFIESQPSISLWRSDGTPQGTAKILDFPPFPEGMELERLEAAGDQLFFTTGNRDISTSKLWHSDLTPAGTVELVDLPFQSDPQVTAVGSAFYFIGSRQLGSYELWRTDGSPAGTAPLPFSPEWSLSTFESLTALDGALYLSFQANAPQQEAQLWRTDGTEAGTGSLATFTAVASPTPLGHQLLFAADDGAHGMELWATDGTAAGTRLVRDINAGPDRSSPSGFTAAQGHVYFSAEDGVHGPELWQTDGTAGGTRLVQDIWPGPAGSGPSGMTAAGSLLFFAANDGVTGNELWALPLSGPTGCVAGPTVLCLQGGRFKVEAYWQDPQGNSGPGQAVALTSDTGYFWFFGPDNVEVIAKVLDGRGVNSSFWVFYGALSNVEYSLTVTDTLTGAARRYMNPSGQLASVADTSAFGPQGAFAERVVGAGSVQVHSVAATAAQSLARVAKASEMEAHAEYASAHGAPVSSCQVGPTVLCLLVDRFAVSVAWRDPTGRTGAGTATSLSTDTGYFWFFTADNAELVLKVLDGRAVNGKFWVFYGALSNVQYTITVTDTVTGRVKTYVNPQGTQASVADTSAF